MDKMEKKVVETEEQKRERKIKEHNALQAEIRDLKKKLKQATMTHYMLRQEIECNEADAAVADKAIYRGQQRIQKDHQAIESLRVCACPCVTCAARRFRALP